MSLKGAALVCLAVLLSFLLLLSIMNFRCSIIGLLRLFGGFWASTAVVIAPKVVIDGELGRD